jgi:hypothetical protein
MYSRKINLMDERLSPQSAHNHCAWKEIPKPGVTTNISKVLQSNQEITDFVVGEMSNTLGGNR